MSQPWIVVAPEGVDPMVVDCSALVKALPGKAGIMLYPAGIFDRDAHLMSGEATTIRRPSPYFTDPDRDGDQHP